MIHLSFLFTACCEYAAQKQNCTKEYDHLFLRNCEQISERFHDELPPEHLTLNLSAVDIVTDILW